MKSKPNIHKHIDLSAEEADAVGREIRMLLEHEDFSIAKDEIPHLLQLGNLLLDKPIQPSYDTR